MSSLKKCVLILWNFYNQIFKEADFLKDILNLKLQMIKQRNQNAYAREQSYIHWVNPFTPINHNKLGSSQAWKIEKKYKYYD